MLTPYGPVYGLYAPPPPLPLPLFCPPPLLSAPQPQQTAPVEGHAGQRAEREREGEGQRAVECAPLWRRMVAEAVDSVLAVAIVALVSAEKRGGRVCVFVCVCVCVEG